MSGLRRGAGQRRRYAFCRRRQWTAGADSRHRCDLEDLPDVVGAIQSLWGGHGRPFFIEPSNRSIYRSPGANIALYLRWTPVRAWRMSANLNSDGSPHDVALNVRARAKVEQRKNGPAMRQILSQEKRRQIIAALKDNPNATQIAREVGCVNYRTVVRLG